MFVPYHLKTVESILILLVIGLLDVLNVLSVEVPKPVNPLFFLMVSLILGRHLPMQVIGQIEGLQMLLLVVSSELGPVGEVLVIVEDGSEVAQAKAVEKPNGTHHSRNGSSSEGPTRESHDHNFVARAVVLANETIAILDVLQIYKSVSGTYA